MHINTNCLVFPETYLISLILPLGRPHFFLRLLRLSITGYYRCGDDDEDDDDDDDDDEDDDDDAILSKSSFIFCQRKM